MDLVIMESGAVTDKDKEEEARMMSKVDELCILPPYRTKMGYVLPSDGNDTTTQFCTRVLHSPIFHLLLSFEKEDVVRAELSFLGLAVSQGKNDGDAEGEDCKDDEDEEEEEEEDGDDDDDDDKSCDESGNDTAPLLRKSKELRRVSKLRRLLGGALVLRSILCSTQGASAPLPARQCLFSFVAMQ